MLVPQTLRWLAEISVIPISSIDDLTNPYTLYQAIATIVPEPYLQQFTPEVQSRGASPVETSGGALVVPWAHVRCIQAIHQSSLALATARPHLQCPVNWLGVVAKEPQELHRLCQWLVLLVLNSPVTASAGVAAMDALMGDQFERTVERFEGSRSRE
ncbi:hypothetical protein DICA2_C16512 [Diutina catenulata]